MAATRGNLGPLLRKAKAEGWAEFIRTENDERAVLAGCYFRRELGQHVVDFCAKFLRHSKGRWAGEPLVLEPDCQIDQIIMPVYGWVRPDGTTRRIRHVTIFVPKKQFKSTFASALGLYALVGDGEAGAEVYCVANDREQAGIVYRSAADMVEKSPELRASLRCVRSQKIIANGTSSWFKALSSETAPAEGLNAHMVIIDEIHVFDERGRTLFDALIYAGAARKQPLSLIISTAGQEQAGVGYEVYERAKELLAGKRPDDMQSFAYITEAAVKDDPSKVSTWRKANPMLGVTLSEEEMREAYNAAKGSIRTLNRFKRYRLNIWGSSAEPWLDMVRWDESPPKTSDYRNFAYDDLRGMMCGVGLDLATKSDITAVAQCFPLEDGFYALKLAFFIPDDMIIEREERDKVPYRDWAADGWITLTEGNVIDLKRIEAYIAGLVDECEVVELAYDPWNAVGIAQNLQDDHGLACVEVRQTIPSLTEASKAFEDLIKDRKIVHFNNPVLRKQACDTRIKTDISGNIRPVKTTSQGKRWHHIDGIVAGIMALGRCMSSDLFGSGSLIGYLDDDKQT